MRSWVDQVAATGPPAVTEEGLAEIAGAGAGNTPVQCVVLPKASVASNDHCNGRLAVSAAFARLPVMPRAPRLTGNEHQVVVDGIGIDSDLHRAVDDHDVGDRLEASGVEHAEQLSTRHSRHAPLRGLD